MPCYDSRDHEPRKVDNPKHLKEIEKLTQENKFLEAGLCAVFNELEKRELFNEIVPEASRKGLIDLMTFWEQHKKDDETRLRNILHTFSVHEQEMMREILSQTTKK